MDSILQTVLLISLGAILGANLRYFVAQYVAKLIPSGFPLGTLIINITASFIMGFFLIWTSERVVEKGQLPLAALNFLFTNVVCFVAVVLGAVLARNL